MDSKEEKLRAARERLRQFQEAKRAAATAGAASGDKTTPSAKDPSPPPAPAPAPLVQVEDASPAPSAPPAASFFVGGDDQDKSTSPSPAPPPPATLGEYFQQQAAAGAAPFGASSVMDSFSSSTAEGDASSASMQVHVGGNSSSGLANEHWSNISLMSRSEVPLGPPSSAFQQVDSFASTTTVPAPAAAVSDSVSRLTEEIGNVLAASSSAAGAEVTSMSAAEMGEEELLRRARTKQMEERNAELEEEVRRQHADLQMMEAQNGTLSSQLSSIQQALADERTQNEDKFKSEVTSVRDQLQAHQESIRILIEEKSVVEAKNKTLAKEADEKTGEIQSLREKVSHLELAAGKQQEELQRRVDSGDQADRRGEEVAAVRRELEAKMVALGERDDELRELRSRLQAREEETIRLREELQEKGGRLEMAELNLAQLRGSTAEQTPATPPVVSSSEGNAEAERERAEKKDKVIRALEERNGELEKREAELTAYIQQAGQDREQIIHQYTTYCQQLTGQLEDASSQLTDKMSENSALTNREADLVAHVERLESQLQAMMSAASKRERKASRSPEPPSLQQPTTPAMPSEARELAVVREKVAELDARLTEVVQERDQLQETLQQKDQDHLSLNLSLAEKTNLISELETQNEMLRSGSVNSSSGVNEELVAACESDKVAASRAMAQNEQLKEQLQELQMAVIKQTNDKAEAVSELDTLRRRQKAAEEGDGKGGGEMGALRGEVSALREAVKERDRAVEQLKSQMKYYVAFAENSLQGRATPVTSREEDMETEKSKMEEELKEAREQIRCLNSHNSELRSQIEVLSSPTREHSNSPRTAAGEEGMRHSSSAMSEDGDSSESSSSSSSSMEETSAEATRHNTPARTIAAAPAGEGNGKVTAAASVSSSTVINGATTTTTTTTMSIPVLSPDVAFVKLEQKFNQAMERLATMATEKEQLEHLNVQLQEETETVGEYITIYQYQRQQIKLRMEEKERQLQLVSREREELKTKLAQVQALFTSFLQEKGAMVPASAVAAIANSAAAAATAAAEAKTASSSSKTSSSASSTSSYVLIEEQQRQQQQEEQHAKAQSQQENGSTMSTEEAEEAMEEKTNGGRVPAASPAASASAPEGDPAAPDDTAGRILALLSEIGSNQMLKEEFHPWFWEPNQGKLMTV